MARMKWDELLSTKRFGMEDYHNPSMATRTEFQRDYDRLIFSSPFRRLQNKTQVFPLPGRIFVHNRLTHSLEVASVGRSLGLNIYHHLTQRGINSPLLSEIGSIVATACLAHDMGNPPLGHSGEKVLSAFFQEAEGHNIKGQMTNCEWNDLTNFEGNANALRLLIHQFNGRREGGFALTYSTLAAMVKYPWDSSKNPNKKYGFFQTEKADYEKIATDLGILKMSPDSWARHPLVYLVEAADDICYQLMDIEDAHKLGILTTRETAELLLNFWDQETEEDRLLRFKHTLERVTDKNEQIAYLRAAVIGKLIDSCTTIFMANYDSIMNGTFEGSLIKHDTTSVGNAYRHCSSVAVKRIYNSAEVLEIEIAGYKILSTLMSEYTAAVLSPQRIFSKQLINRVPSQYQLTEGSIYHRIRAVLDFISGMTDIYALDLYRKITGINLPGVD